MRRRVVLSVLAFLTLIWLTVFSDFLLSHLQVLVVVVSVLTVSLLPYLLHPSTSLTCSSFSVLDAALLSSLLNNLILGLFILYSSLFTTPSHLSSITVLLSIMSRCCWLLSTSLTMLVLSLYWQLQALLVLVLSPPAPSLASSLLENWNNGKLLLNTAQRNNCWDDHDQYPTVVIKM